MATITLTLPVAGTVITAGLHANNYTAIQTAINGGLDNNNIAVGAGISVAKLAGPYTAYTPAWTGTGTNPAIGNGTIAGRYLQIGKLVVAHINVTVGSTTTFGSAGWILSLPVAANAAASVTALARFTDASAGEFIGFVRVNTVNDVALFSGGVGSVGSLATSAVPFAWTNPDQINVDITYEAA